MNEKHINDDEKETYQQLLRNLGVTIHISSKGVIGFTFTAHPERTTVYSLKLETAQ